MSSLRLLADQFAILAGFDTFEVKIVENKSASDKYVWAYNIFVRKPGSKRGKCVGCITPSYSQNIRY